MTNQKLWQSVEKDLKITKEVLDIFLELDSTGSVTTQAELNEMLITLYKRLGKEEIIIEPFGSGPCSQVAFKNWINDNMDTYTAGLFNDGIK